ncbi:hypothetical protein OSTOST_08136 [Ostertagia ostertagi]
MEIVGAVTVEVALKGGKKDKVTFHITPLPQEEVLLGMNALHKRKGIHGMGTNKEAKVARRAYIPPHASAMTEVECHEDGSTERVMWANRKEVASGVFQICNKRATVPIHNDEERAMLLREGEEVGEWSTEKWHERWEDLNPFMMDSDHEYAPKEQRRQQLVQQLEENMGGEKLDDELMRIVLKFVYGKCIEWTDIICNAKSIAEHTSIENHQVHRSYSEALQKLREEIDEQVVRERPRKTGPVLFAAFEGANPMEKDGVRSGILTKVIHGWDRLVEVLESWKTSSVGHRLAAGIRDEGRDCYQIIQVDERLFGGRGPYSHSLAANCVKKSDEIAQSVGVVETPRRNTKEDRHQ